MPKQPVVLNGIAYIRSREAARAVQFTSDYITALARGGLIDGRRIMGLWYVDLDSVRAFIAEQERQKEIWRRQLAVRRREEQRLAGHPSARGALFA